MVGCHIFHYLLIFLEKYVQVHYFGLIKRRDDLEKTILEEEREEDQG